MIGVVIATHGRLAHELLQTAVFIVGKEDQMKAISIDPSKDIKELKAEIKKVIEEVSTGEGVIVLTDMYGGTPSNMTLSFLKENEVEVVTGVNLPMIIRICQSRKKRSFLSEIAQEVVEYGRKSINQATEILQL
jgi:PTS system mannose-specific IIA component